MIRKFVVFLLSALLIVHQTIPALAFRASNFVMRPALQTRLDEEGLAALTAFVRMGLIRPKRGSAIVALKMILLRRNRVLSGETILLPQNNLFSSEIFKESSGQAYRRSIGLHVWDLKWRLQRLLHQIPMGIVLGVQTLFSWALALYSLHAPTWMQPLLWGASVGLYGTILGGEPTLELPRDRKERNT